MGVPILIDIRVAFFRLSPLRKKKMLQNMVSFISEHREREEEEEEKNNVQVRNFGLKTMCKKYICRFQIAMNYVVTMNVRHRVRNALDHSTKMLNIPKFSIGCLPSLMKRTLK